MTYIIEHRYKEFEIVGTAENGQEGLEKIALLKPNIVITDVKMPIMDGIELAAHIKQDYPNIYCIIASGYDDFEYARGALKSGVVDYLLKPINAAQLKKLLYSLKEQIESNTYNKQIEILNCIYNQHAINKEEVKDFFPHNKYFLAIIRENRLPVRFSEHRSLGYLRHDRKHDTYWIIQGRDSMELIIISSGNEVDGRAFNHIVNQVKEQLPGNYYITIINSTSIKLFELKKVALNLCKVMDNNIIIGLPQTIDDTAKVNPEKDKRAVLETTLSNRLDYYVSNGMDNELKQELIKLFEYWENNRFTQLWVENQLRQILKRIEKLSAKAGKGDIYDMEFYLEETLVYCTSYGELMASFWDIILKIMKRLDVKNIRLNTPEFFKSVEEYIYENLSEPLSLQSICSAFGISQTYMSRLFRKFKKMSFSEYITSLKVDKAKQIISINPDIAVKDVAELVGFNDPFYFSRVFRSITGVPPSQFTIKGK